MDYKVGQVGLGFVGGALHESFKKRGIETLVYDKYLNIGSLEDLKDCEVVFLCLPTPYVAGHGFDLGPILETCKKLTNIGFGNLVAIKSTVEPGVTQKLQDKFPMKFCHNPEFLTARTALEDFDNQEHIVLGIPKVIESDEDGETPYTKTLKLGELYKRLYPRANISYCTSEESESMKLFVNNFYAMKVQIFNEFRFLCQKTGADYEVVKDLMIKNGWINPMHTLVPGPDGLPSYGGACFPKDTNALLHLMKTLGSPCKVLEATIEERNEMREEKWK